LTSKNSPPILPTVESNALSKSKSNGFFGSVTQCFPHIKSNAVRALATCGAKRAVALPDVPTMAEAGIPEFETKQWWGILAPTGTPVTIVDRLSKELKAILALDEVKKRYLNDGSEIDYLGPTEFRTFSHRELDQWASVIKKGNIKLE
jgi:tripartite-type tricarboxylate transporter receptor subunit TctC